MNRSGYTVDALHAAFSLLADSDSALATSVRSQLSTSTGLSLPMIEWGLRTSLPTDQNALAQALSQGPHVSDRRVAVILSGNLFTACIRALGWPLLLGASVTAKAASHDDVLPRALHQALKQVSPEVASRLNVKTFDRHDQASLRALVNDCDVVSAYGSDATLDAIHTALRPGVPLIRHGHGVGVLYVAANALESEVRARHWAERAALDIAAYDQRGCLSPHVVFVQEGGGLTTQQFADALVTALTHIEGTLPRGTLSEHDLIAQSQWRGLMASCADLVDATSFAVAQLDSFPTAPIPSFTGPGYRNVCIARSSDVPALMQQLAALGEHLKCIGVAGDADEQIAINHALPTTLRPVVCAAGKMQTPAFDSPADGEPPWFGFT